MRWIARRRFAAAFALVAGAHTSVAQTITAVDTPHPWQFASAPHVSGDGEHVVGTLLDFSAGEHRAFRMRVGGPMTVIAPPAPYLSHVCLGVNQLGDRVLLTADNGAGPTYIWRTDGTLTHPFGNSTDNLMRGISADGRVLLGGNITGTFTWTADTGYTYLTPAFNRRARPNALSSDGSIAVGDCPRTFPVGDPPVNASEVSACLWLDGAVTLLHTPDSTAFGVNSDGTAIVGEVRQGGAPPIAYRWGASSGAIAFPQGPQGSVADRVSGDGSVITGSGLRTTPGGIPYNGPWIWTEQSGTMPFEEYLSARGVTLGGWVLSTVQSISMDGLVFAGTGALDGFDRVYVVDLRPPVPPIVITTQPAWRRTCNNTSATLTIRTSAPPAAVLWQLADPADLSSWMDLSDGPLGAACATVSGANTLTLQVVWDQDGNCPPQRTFRARASNAAGVANYSDPVTVDSLQPHDFNGDGDIGTDADIEAFFACLGGDCCPTCGSIDYNNDGDIGTDADIESFFRVLGGGPC
ncbi:MAG TPA: hypothetical protein VD997_06325 [Phycisphaerales bacterium]|nr:hypothetical protein [Phycisphaerales bacterium]